MPFRLPLLMTPATHDQFIKFQVQWIFLVRMILEVLPLFPAGGAETRLNAAILAKF